MKLKNYLLPALCLFAAAAATAQDATPITLHGFGEWAYVRTNGNEYLSGNDEGDYDTVGLGLNASTTFGDNLSITGQFAVRSRSGEDPGAELDYAFAQYKASDALQLRFGRSKHPFGIYTEVFDVGTLRPFFHLPLSIYGPAEVAAQSYDGAGVTGTLQMSGGMSVDYDAYVGEIAFSGEQRADEGEDLASEKIRDVFGGRVRFHTPIDGLSVGASAYSGIVEEDHEEEGEEESHVRNRGLGLHLEYAMHPFVLRAEVGDHDEAGEAEARGFYVEGAYRIRDKWELAARYDRFDVTEEDDDESEEHRDLALGVNYWFNRNIVLKLSMHRVQGLAAAVPDDDGDEKTNAIVFGSQFSF